MAHPKRRHSKQRTRKRRASNWKLKLASLSSCSHCGKPVIPHRVCPFCGYYKGKPVIDITQKEEEQEEAQK